ncbi:MAG: hypothetical protein FWD59_00330 [Micrococcales bacterium]|nr:hypothetical protein [Micrococcales bacterium]
MAVKTFRTDAETERALEYLGGELGDNSFTSIVRYSLVETERALRRAALRAEAKALRENPADVQEMRAVMEDMEALSAW